MGSNNSKHDVKEETVVDSDSIISSDSSASPNDDVEIIENQSIDNDKTKLGNNEAEIEISSDAVNAEQQVEEEQTEKEETIQSDARPFDEQMPPSDPRQENDSSQNEQQNQQQEEAAHDRQPPTVINIQGRVGNVLGNNSMVHQPTIYNTTNINTTYNIYYVDPSSENVDSSSSNNNTPTSGHNTASDNISVSSTSSSTLCNNTTECPNCKCAQRKSGKQRKHSLANVAKDITNSSDKTDRLPSLFTEDDDDASSSKCEDLTSESLSSLHSEDSPKNWDVPNKRKKRSQKSSFFNKFRKKKRTDDEMKELDVIKTSPVVDLSPCYTTSHLIHLRA